MKFGHTFHPSVGFTGSTGKNVKPSIPGYAHGGMDEVEHEGHEHGDHPKHDHVSYDHQGYEHHKGHGHKQMHRMHKMKHGGAVCE